MSPVLIWFCCFTPAILILMLAINLLRSRDNQKTVYQKYMTALDALASVRKITFDNDYCDSYKMREELEEVLNHYDSEIMRINCPDMPPEEQEDQFVDDDDCTKT